MCLGNRVAEEDSAPVTPKGDVVTSLTKCGRRLGIVLALTAAVGLASPASGFAATGGSRSKVCGRSDVAQRVRTDHARFAAGQAVTIKVTATNGSGHDCAMPSISTVRVRPAAGKEVWQTSVAVDWIRGAVWRSGRSVSWTFTWDQQICSAAGCSGTATPGAYVASGSWDSYTPGAARFIINGIK